MPCPICGSRSPAELIAPGAWRCGSTKVVPGYTAFAPPFAPANPTASAAAIDIGPSVERCPGTYQPAPGELTDDQRAQEAALIESINERQGRVAEWRREVPEMLAGITDPIARLMAVVRNWGRSGLVLSGLYPEGALGNLDRSPPWDHDAVQTWFLASVTVPAAEQPVVEDVRSLLGGRKRKPGRALGWAFVKGSTRSSFDDDGDWDAGARGPELLHTIYVLRDGRRRSGGGVPARPGEGFNFKAVDEMAGMSRVPKLPLAPPLTAREDAEDRRARQQAPSTYATLRDIMEERGARSQKF